MDLEKYFTTLTLAGIALVSSLGESKLGFAPLGLGLLLVSAIVSSVSMIKLWETTTMPYTTMPIKRGFWTPTKGGINRDEFNEVPRLGCMLSTQ